MNEIWTHLSVTIERQDLIITPWQGTPMPYMSGSNKDQKLDIIVSRMVGAAVIS